MKVEVEPTVLRWIVSTSGWDDEELAKRLKVNRRTFDGWLTGKVRPTLRQLERLAEITRKPVATFFLSEPVKGVDDYEMVMEAAREEGTSAIVEMLAEIATQLSRMNDRVRMR